MREEDQKVEPTELAAAAMANRSLLVSLLVVLEVRGVLSRTDVEMIADAALTGVETAPGVDARVRDQARRMLEQSARNLAETRRNRSGLRWPWIRP
jgi:hypothetical protein